MITSWLYSVLIEILFAKCHHRRLFKDKVSNRTDERPLDIKCWILKASTHNDAYWGWHIRYLLYKIFTNYRYKICPIAQVIPTWRLELKRPKKNLKVILDQIIKAFNISTIWKWHGLVKFGNVTRVDLPLVISRVDAVRLLAFSWETIQINDGWFRLRLICFFNFVLKKTQEWRRDEDDVDDGEKSGGYSSPFDILYLVSIPPPESRLFQWYVCMYE